MQQTEVYKLNLVEPSDPFLPDALNRNTQKMEDAMVSHEGRVDKRMDGLEDRIALFEAKRFVYGTLEGSGMVTVDLGFTPVAVIVSYSNITRILVQGGISGELKIMDSGFTFSTGGVSGPYSYIAFG